MTTFSLKNMTEDQEINLKHSVESKLNFTINDGTTEIRVFWNPVLRFTILPARLTPNVLASVVLLCRYLSIDSVQEAMEEALCLS